MWPHVIRSHLPALHAIYHWNNILFDKERHFFIKTICWGICCQQCFSLNVILKPSFIDLISIFRSFYCFKANYLFLIPPLWCLFSFFWPSFTTFIIFNLCPLFLINFLCFFFLLLSLFCDFSCFMTFSFQFCWLHSSSQLCLAFLNTSD